jgi:hypothetical protein
MARVFAQSAAARRPRPASLTDYAADLARRVAREVAALLALGLATASGGAGVLGWVAALLVAVGAAALVVAAVRLARRRPRRQTAAGQGAPHPGGPPLAGGDAAAWRDELERRLLAGDAPGALEAAWWWLARSLLGGAVDAAWTGRELIDRAGRPDLLPLVRRLDLLAYGPRRPRVDEVRGCARRVAEALG